MVLLRFDNYDVMLLYPYDYVIVTHLYFVDTRYTMGEREGKQMSLYGKYYLSPEEMAGLWKNVLRRTERIRRNHLANNGDGSKLWSGIKQWSSNELESMKDSFYGKRTRTTVADNFSTYNRLFHQRDDYDGKIHRDDRNHILKIGRAVHDEVSVHVSLLFIILSC